MHFNSSHPVHCAAPNPEDMADIIVTGAGIGKINKTANVTEYRVGVVSCRRGLMAENKTYTNCNQSVGTLQEEDITCFGK